MRRIAACNCTTTALPGTCGFIYNGREHCIRLGRIVVWEDNGGEGVYFAGVKERKSIHVSNPDLPAVAEMLKMLVEHRVLSPTLMVGTAPTPMLRTSAFTLERNAAGDVMFSGFNFRVLLPAQHVADVISFMGGSDDALQRETSGSKGDGFNISRVSLGDTEPPMRASTADEVTSYCISPYIRLDKISMSGMVSTGLASKTTAGSAPLTRGPLMAVSSSATSKSSYRNFFS